MAIGSIFQARKCLAWLAHPTVKEAIFAVRHCPFNANHYRISANFCIRDNQWLTTKLKFCVTGPT